MVEVLDTEGHDIWPDVQRWAAEYGVPAVGFLALLQAESGLNRTIVLLGLT